MSDGQAMPLIEVEHLTMRFGGLLAIDDVSFSGKPGEITAIIGPNGAGKTTVFNCITGFYKPTIGRKAISISSRWMVSASRGRRGLPARFRTSAFLAA